MWERHRASELEVHTPQNRQAGLQDIPVLLWDTTNQYFSIAVYVLLCSRYNVAANEERGSANATLANGQGIFARRSAQRATS